MTVTPSLPTPPSTQPPLHLLSSYDYHLPPELIAQHPAGQRTASRLLDGTAGLHGGVVDRHFADLPTLLRAGDLLILNDTQVVKARLFGHKQSGGKLELLIERVLPSNTTQANARHEVVAHMKVSKKPAIGDAITLDGDATATLLGRWPDADGALFHFALDQDPYMLMQQHGHLPLPPYIEHTDEPEDQERYQTVFAKSPGAVAAPTASLHFDQPLLVSLQTKGVQTAHVTLHVGAGTFAPVKTDDIRAHTMHAERYHIPPETVAAINATRAAGGRIVAVGTTCVRTLESWAQTGATSGDTQIFITPGFAFQIVDVLITNFHLPKSTLMMLVSAFAGYEHTLHIYRHAISQRYRFFSYGDAMILTRPTMDFSAATLHAPIPTIA